VEAADAALRYAFFHRELFKPTALIPEDSNALQPNPNLAKAVLEKSVGPSIPQGGQPVVLGEYLERGGSRIPQAKSVPRGIAGANPQVSRRIFKHLEDVVAAQAVLNTVLVSKSRGTELG
jgi:hypothetical protein